VPDDQLFPTPAGSPATPGEQTDELARILAEAPPADERPASERLTSWLCGLVLSHDYGTLADLRRLTIAGRGRGGTPTRARLLAAGFAPEEDQRTVYERVAFLFARYHAGASRPHRGFGNMGDALRKVGSAAGRGPRDAGATRLLDRLVASRDIPWRHLQHAVERARAGDTAPPSWAQLAEDLSRWKSRDRAVPYEWARSFYTPAYPKNGTTA